MKAWVLVLCMVPGILGAQSSRDDDQADALVARYLAAEPNPRHGEALVQGSPSRNSPQEQTLLTALTWNPLSSDARTLLAELYWATGRPQAAAGEFKGALEQGKFRRLNPLRAREGLVKSLAGLGRWDQIMNLKIHLEPSGAHSASLAKAFVDASYFSGKKEEAWVLLNQAQSLFPQDPRFLSAMLRRPEKFPLLEKYLIRFKTLGFQLSREDLLGLIRSIDPEDEKNRKEAFDLVWRLGYRTPELAAWGVFEDRLTWAQAQDLWKTQGIPQDYGLLAVLAQKDPALAWDPKAMTGRFSWDTDGDERPDQFIILEAGDLVAWEKDVNQDLVCEVRMVWEGSQLVSLEQWSPAGGQWSFHWQDYPYLDQVQNHYFEDQNLIKKTLVFPMYKKVFPLWEGRLEEKTPSWLWPSRLEGFLAFQSVSTLWNAQDLVKDAGEIRIQRGSEKTWHRLWEGQVFFSARDLQGDGRWDEYVFKERPGTSVYRDLDGDGIWDIWERTLDSQRKIFLGNLSGRQRTDWALIENSLGPVQLWDFAQDGFADLVLWNFGRGDQVAVVPFSGEKIPWAQIPPWTESVRP